MKIDWNTEWEVFGTESQMTIYVPTTFTKDEVLQEAGERGLYQPHDATCHS